jgi:VIT1/CCC1 family predicted Fe2+/Mn2+ transporter
VKPNKGRVLLFVIISRILGLEFGIKLMEKWEVYAQKAYEKYIEYIPETAVIQHDEEEHEQKLIAMINNKWLSYIWSIVLWLNDALVELTWVLAWLTLGLQDPKLIAIVWLITGISASLSMWASEYLSTKAEWWENALTASFYTWVAYISTVVLLILPFLLISNPFIAMSITMAVAVIIIAVFNWYVSVVKEYNFRHRFWEMVWISMSVAVISFGIWLLVRYIFWL